MIILGIDPGISGGLALIESGERPRLLEAIDIPITGEAAKQRVNVTAVIRFIKRAQAGFIERAQAMPDQGASSGFLYGRAVGALEATIVGMGIPHTIVESSAWKKSHGLIKPSDIDGKAWSRVVKENSRQRALQLFPEGQQFFPLKKDHGKAEAALIGRHGLILLGALSPRHPQAAE